MTWIRLPNVLPAALSLALASAPTRADAQVGDFATRLGVAHLVYEADAAHAAFRPGDALEDLEEALRIMPDDYEALWRAAREAVNLGMLDPSGDEAGRWFESAEGYARRAREANPRGPEGGEWLAIALGRRALEVGPRSRVRLAVEIREVALETLALDSTNAGAHHVLGEWNAQIRRLSGIERWMARKFMGGGVFDQASWADAEEHLLEAIRYDPAGLVHYVDLAKVYLDAGREDDARQALRQVLERPAVEPVDPLHKQEAQELLRRR
jgi:tetratricopeptide (TPR) repeat protein